MLIDKAKIELIYKNYNVTKDFSPYINEIIYTDFEENSSDELKIRLNDCKNLFKSSWYPDKGTLLSCKIGLRNTDEILNCGKFTVDENELISDLSGDEFMIKALAVTITKPLRTIHTRSFNNRTLIQIADELGNSGGFTLCGKLLNTFLSHITQVNESDMAFLKRLGKQFGYIFKLTNDLLVFMPENEFINAKSIMTLNKENIKNLILKDTCTNTYSKCIVKYFNPREKKLNICELNNDNCIDKDTLKITARFDSLQTGSEIAKHGLNSKSKEIKGTITLKKPNLKFIAGINFNLSGYGKYDGKYHVLSTQHRINSQGYEITGEIEKC